MLKKMKAMVAVTGCALDLRLRGFSAVCQPALNAAPGETGPADRAWLENHWSALVATGRLPWSTCLTRSMVLWRLARRRELHGSLRLQVNRPAPGLRAHAWIEFSDLCLGREEGPGARLAPLPR